MSKDICSVRINRFSTLLRMLISSSLSAGELTDAAKITSRHMPQRDICYLKKFCGAEIECDHSKKRCPCTTNGTFLLQLKLTNDGSAALSAGLETARHFLPYLDEACADVRRRFEEALSSGSVSHGNGRGGSMQGAKMNRYQKAFY